MTILLDNGTWLTPVTNSSLGASGAASTTDFHLLSALDIGIGGGTGLAQSVFGPTLEGKILWMAVTTISNTDSTGFGVSIRRNGTTDVVTINFDPDEVGRRARILSIPFLVTDHLQIRIHHRQGFSVTNYSLMVAGKIG
ncbi:MAG TPA: hypothetical protein ENI23_11970 [bacterium]|nr:hypothetical protein [bacterium]